MKDTLVTILRDKNTSIDQFRKASEKLGFILASEVSQYLEKQNSSIKNNIVLIPILRSGIAFLVPFLNVFEKARVGFVGLQRDEKTAIAKLYYDKIPPISQDDDVILLDPMIATGGSAIDALEILKKKGAREEKIIFVSIIGSIEGLELVQTKFPKIKIIVPAIDKKLDSKKFIVPGLGDFGDRFFGTDNMKI